MTSQYHLTPLLVAVAAGAIAWLVAHRMHLNRRPKPPGGRWEGFAGWLAFLAGLQWLAVVHTFGDFLGALERYAKRASATLSPTGQAGFIAAVALQGLLFGFVLWSAILMHRKSRRFPRLFRIEMVLLVLIPAVTGLLAWEAQRQLASSQLALAYWLRAALFAPAAGIGFVYSLHSARFRNMFVR